MGAMRSRPTRRRRRIAFADDLVVSLGEAVAALDERAVASGERRGNGGACERD
jgi:hypothetical protein